MVEHTTAPTFYSSGYVESQQGLVLLKMPEGVTIVRVWGDLGTESLTFTEAEAKELRSMLVLLLDYSADRPTAGGGGGKGPNSVLSAEPVGYSPDPAGAPQA